MIRNYDYEVQKSYTLCLYFLFIRDDTHITSMKIIQFPKPSTPLLHLRPKFFYPLDLGRPLSNETPSSFLMITNQLKENIIQGWLLHVIRSFLQFGFRFQYQLINFVWLSFGFFSFSWSLTTCFCLALYSFVCSNPKVSNVFFYNFSHFWYSFGTSLFYFHNLKT